jgi:hypothetical protein
VEAREAITRVVMASQMLVRMRGLGEWRDFRMRAREFWDEDLVEEGCVYVGRRMDYGERLEGKKCDRAVRSCQK